MVIYEVNLQLQKAIYTDYIKWLKAHIEKMLTFNGFKDARCLEEINCDNSKFIHITVQYELDNMENLQNYFAKHAQKMREEGLAKFGGQFTAQRRIFIVKES